VVRRAARVDANHGAIVSALRKVGCSVLDLSRLAHGTPDVLIYSPRMCAYVLVEIKDGAKAPSKRKLTEAQIKFHNEWRGPVVVVESVDEALALFGGVR
jgi:hypothetical protein